MDGQTKRIIIMPAHNEAGNIERVIKELRQAVKGLDIAVIDDFHDLIKGNDFVFAMRDFTRVCLAAKAAVILFIIEGRAERLVFFTVEVHFTLLLAKTSGDYII